MGVLAELCDVIGVEHPRPATERAAEEANGLVRWLRPQYQAPEEARAQQAALLEVAAEGEAQPEPAEKQKWPKTLKARAQAVRRALAGFDGPASVEEVASAFTGRRTKKRLGQIEEILEMLVALGQAQEDGGRYVVG